MTKFKNKVLKMNKEKEIKILKEILKDIRDLQSLSQFKDYKLTKKQALVQLNAITQNLKDNFTEFIENQ